MSPSAEMILTRLAALKASCEDSVRAECLRGLAPELLTEVVQALLGHCHTEHGLLTALIKDEDIGPRLPARHIEHVLESLAAHPLPVARQGAADGLARYLLRLSVLTRTEVIAEWTTCRRAFKRAAVARALRNPEITALGIVPALELLAEDHSAEVRLAAVEAAADRIECAPQRCTAVLSRHARDPRRSIRLAAVEGLRRSVLMGANDDAVPVLMSCIETTDMLVAEHAVAALAESASSNHDTLRWMEIMVRQVDELDTRLAASILATVRKIAASQPERACRILLALRQHPVAWLREQASATLAELRGAGASPMLV